jgi:hypothetical protein
MEMQSGDSEAIQSTQHGPRTLASANRVAVNLDSYRSQAIFDLERDRIFARAPDESSSRHKLPRKKDDGNAPGAAVGLPRIL